MSRRESATDYMVLLSALMALVSRYSGQDEIAIGSPVANRRKVELERLIGCFANTIVIKTNVDRTKSFRELLRRVKEDAIGAYTNDEYPFEKLVEDLNPTRSLSHTPLFQVMFAMENMPMDPVTISGVTITPLDIDTGTAKFDLTLFIQEREGALEATFEYNTDLFDHSTIKRMISHWHRLIESAVENPDEQICDLQLLTEREYEQIIIEWNKSDMPLALDMSVHGLIEEQARNTPHSIAARYMGTRLTYSELDRRSSILGNRLRGEGVGPDVLVGIYMERSLELMIAILGVLKAGGAFVPLDPVNPDERLRFMIEDAGLSLILTQERLASNLDHKRAKVFCVDGGWLEEDDDERDDPGPNDAPYPENLAYMIYTSGSTGKPKGTMITHRGLLNYLQWSKESYRVEEGDGAPVHTSIGFDLTITSLFTPLLAGRTVVILPQDQGVGLLDDALRNEGKFSLLKLTPSHLDLLSRLIGPEEAETCANCFVIGGEALHWETLSFWIKHAPKTRMINEYGPTETVVGCCVYEYAGDKTRGQTVPIGRPIANTTIYILGKELEVMPVGATGEIYIGGYGLARGYINNPGLTAERFIPDPFGAKAGARLYKTGDLGKYLMDGQIEYLGRFDNQIKLRGYRIELGEIEAALTEFPGVTKAAVLLNGDGPEDNRVIAYVVAESEKPAVGDELHYYLRERLPDYMIPSAFVFLDEIPLNSNGKIDRNMLPIPGQTRARLGDEFILPRTPIEETIAQIWSQVIGVDQVGIYDNIFELGGHSLMIAQLAFRLKETFYVEIPFRRFFEALTVAELAVAIVQAQAEQIDNKIVAPILAEIEDLSQEDAEKMIGGDSMEYMRELALISY